MLKKLRTTLKSARVEVSTSRSPGLAVTFAVMIFSWRSGCGRLANITANHEDMDREGIGFYSDGIGGRLVSGGQIKL